jgi:hypothetical protein
MERLALGARRFHAMNVKALIVALRPQQWVKNVFVMAPYLAEAE